MKRKLTWIQQVFSIIILISTITACFPPIDLNHIMNRKNDTTTFAINGTNLTTFNPLDVNVANELQILVNLHSSLVSVDAYGRNFGDIATQTDKKKLLVGEYSSSDYKTWTYYINPPKEKKRRYWYDWKGKIKREINAYDFLNALKYGLNSKNIYSKNGYLWDKLVNYKTISDYFSKNTIPDYVNDPIWEKLGVKVINDYTITFTFLKPYQAFESLLASVQTALLPQEAFLLPNYGKDYRDVWYSGAYVIADYQPGSYLKLRKNENYWFANNTHIKNLTFHFVKNSQPAMLRSLFEQGDISEIKIDPNDVDAWNRYVGSDIKNPKYEGTKLEKSTDRYSKFISFNFLNNAINDTTNPEKKQQALNASKALQNQDIRNWIRYYLNRNTAISYKTKNIEQKLVSSLLINSYTHPHFVPFAGHDKINYMDNLYTELTKSIKKSDPSMTEAKVKALFAPGQDPFFHSNIKPFALNSTAKAEIRDWLKRTIGASKVVLTVLVQGIDLEVQKAMLDTIDEFNESDKTDRIVELKPIIAKDNIEYKKMHNNGDYDLDIGLGWGPDDNSVTSYLVAQKLTGGAAGINGLGKLFSNLSYQNDGEAPPWEQVKKSQYLLQLENDKTKIFYDQLQEVHNLIVKSQSQSEIKPQFSFAAQAEAKLIYDYNLLIPFGVNEINVFPILTYIIPYTQSKVDFGTSKFKFWGVKLSDRLINRAKQEEYKTIYQSQLETIANNYDAYRDDY